MATANDLKVEVSFHPEIESYKDKVIDDLVLTLKRYAGIGEREIAGRAPTCEGYGWTKDGRFCWMNNVGMVEDGKGPLLALETLRNYNLIE